MHFIRIIQAATKNTKRTKKLTNKPSKQLPKKDKNTKRFTQNAPRRTLTKKPNNPIKTKGIYPLQDISLPIFEDLLEQGYNMITLVAWSGACAYCKKKNGTTMSLNNWLNQLQHSAPVFEAFHVNSQSELKVWDKKGELPDVFVNYEGDIRQ